MRGRVGQCVGGGLRLQAARRHSVHQLPVRPHEPQRAIVQDPHIESALMHGTMMKPAQRHEIRRLGLAAIRPMLDVMGIEVARIAAARKPATLVARFEQTA